MRFQLVIAFLQKKAVSYSSFYLLAAFWLSARETLWSNQPKKIEAKKKKKKKQKKEQLIKFQNIKD